MYRFCTPRQVEDLCVIHYGSIKYIPELVYSVKNDLSKPRGGLWTSSINSSHSWKSWCEMEDFRECDELNSFKLRFHSTSKILLIDNIKDFKALPIINFGGKFKTIDFESISKKCDAIWLTERGERETRYPEWMTNVSKSDDPSDVSLYGWDVETIWVINNKCCYQISKENDTI